MRKRDMQSMSISDLLFEYRKSAIDAISDNHVKQNRAVDRLMACYRLLRESEQGKQGIIAMMGDPMPNVRLWSAGFCLQWTPVEAKNVLEELQNPTKYGLIAFNSKMTLFQFEKGVLHFDW